MKTASWFLILFFAGLLVYSFAQVPATDSIRVLHVASRYQQRSEMETGIHSKVGAVMADYRSMDLLAVVVLISTAALGFLFFFNASPRLSGLFPGFHLLILGVLLALGTGFLCLWKGANFLDYEGLVSWAGPGNARLEGALALLGGCLLVLGGLLMLGLKWLRFPGGSSGR
ncbi:MAG TPA: hypothetical protein VJ873_06050 [bacterium]|nr:hypothetical protein [bacterium]